jgi:hypothetical protein
MRQRQSLRHGQMNVNFDRARFGVWTLAVVLGGLTLGTIGCGSSDGTSSGSETNGGNSGGGDQVAAAMSGSVIASAAGNDTTGGTAGTDTTSDAGAPGVVSRLAEYSIASTGRGSCALDGKGAIHCWGLSPEPWAMPAGQFVELHASTDEICAVRSDRTVECFDEPGLAAGGGRLTSCPQAR